MGRFQACPNECSRHLLAHTFGNGRCQNETIIHFQRGSLWGSIVKTSCSRTGSPSTKQPVLELDANKQLELIAGAEHAIMDRMDVNRSNDGSERQMLENVLTVLGQLRKIADDMAKRAHGST